MIPGNQREEGHKTNWPSILELSLKAEIKIEDCNLASKKNQYQLYVLSQVFYRFGNVVLYRLLTDI